MFAKNLKYLREKNHMEQLDLAKELGRKSASSISAVSELCQNCATSNKKELQTLI